MSLSITKSPLAHPCFYCGRTLVGNQECTWTCRRDAVLEEVSVHGLHVLAGHGPTILIGDVLTDTLTANSVRIAIGDDLMRRFHLTVEQQSPAIVALTIPKS